MMTLVEKTYGYHNFFLKEFQRFLSHLFVGPQPKKHSLQSLIVLFGISSGEQVA